MYYAGNRIDLTCANGKPSHLVSVILTPHDTQSFHSRRPINLKRLILEHSRRSDDLHVGSDGFGLYAFQRVTKFGTGVKYDLGVSTTHRQEHLGSFVAASP